ncbi:MAG: F0F1 ATP synthase subunit A [Putridiphycobacter sp.]
MKNAFKVLFFSVLLIANSSLNAQVDLEKELNHLMKGVSEYQDNPDHKSAEDDEVEKGFDPVHHVLDAHDIHLAGEVSIPLPVILWTDNGLVTFMSSEFHHDDTGHHKVEKNGMTFVKMHEKIYQLNASAEHLELNHETHEPLNAKLPLDFSITKVVVAIFLVAFIMFFVFKRVAKRYSTEKPEAPKGIAAWMEPLVLFVRDFSKENIGEAKYMKFMPYLLTVFFFIWFGNLLGLIPFIGGINMTGNISITLTLALITLVIQMIHSKWAFWKHMLMPPGVPVALYPILVPIELAGIFIKPAALTIRLFANITGGHIMVLSIIGIIITKQSFGWAGLSVPLSLFISILEATLVAFLQAYIFTMLSSMFIGAAVDEGHH